MRLTIVGWLVAALGVILVLGAVNRLQNDGEDPRPSSNPAV
jgi:hypothetical protein